MAEQPPGEIGVPKSNLGAILSGMVPSNAVGALSGLNNQTFIEPHVQSRTLEDAAKLGIELLRAIRTPDSSLDLLYQPLVNTKNDRLVGFKALLRWATGSGAMVAPKNILHIAARNSISELLDLWVLQLSIISAAQWLKARPDLIVSITMSPTFLASPQFTQMFKALLHLHKVQAPSICIEVTLGVMLAPQIMANLGEMRSMGVKLALELRGATKISSASRCLGMPVDIFKLNRRFIVGRILSSHDEGFLSGLVRQGHAQGATLTIEGVSSAEDVAVARRIGCDTGQGDWYGRAVDAASAGALVMANRSAWHQATARAG